jgi:hypothetical protein
MSSYVQIYKKGQGNGTWYRYLVRWSRVHDLAQERMPAAFLADGPGRTPSPIVGDPYGSASAFRSNQNRSQSLSYCCDIMSLAKEHLRNYELVDVDVSIVSMDYATDTTNGIDTGHAGQAPPSLPTGEVIDSKNTLQSFDAHPAAAMPSDDALENPVHPTLPGGAVITGKNTLQTFDVDGPANQPTSMDSPFDPLDDVKRSPDEPPNPAITMTTTSPPATVVAVAVEADIVYAEIAPEVVSSTISMDQNEYNKATPHTASWYRRRSTILILTIFALSLATGLGLYFGLGKFNSSIDPYRATILTSYINNFTLTNKTITPNDASPENKALQWMIANDKTLDTSAVISEDDPIARNAIGFRIRQRYALLTMWFQQNDTEKWDNVDGWLVDPNECFWSGIKCDRRDVDYFYDVNKGMFYGGNQYAIIQISFRSPESYVGMMPADIGLLTSLQHFEMKGTYGDETDSKSFLHGQLPESIGYWTALTYFDVSFNALTGVLPDSIDRWTALAHFDVNSNTLTGTLPESIGNWNALIYFDAGYNGLTGQFPESIGYWTALTYFDVINNTLTGTLPESIGNWTALTYFDAGYIGLTGILPDSISQWSVLTYFDVSSNTLTGTLPDSVGRWTDLSIFFVSFNDLTGALPDSIGHWTALTYFDVGGNYLNGTIPSSIENWSLIEFGNFSDNQFVGTMPNAICQYIDSYTGYLEADCEILNCTCCYNNCFDL